MRVRVAWNFSLACFLLLGLACEKPEVKPVNLEGKAGQNELRAVVGKAGGTLQFDAGGAKLEIPAGLLREDVNIHFKREEPSLDLAGRDFVGKAYRISPKLNFNPGFAKLYVPVDRQLPGMASEIDMKLFMFGKKVTSTPAGDTFTNQWIPTPLNKFIETADNGKMLVFVLYETISNRTTKAPNGLLQASFALNK